MTKDKKENKLGTLLTFFLIFTGMWFGVFRLLIYLIEKQTDNPNESFQLITWMAVASSFCVTIYIITITKALFYHTIPTYWKNIDPKKLKQKQENSYQNVMQGWFELIIANIIVILTIIYKDTFGLLGSLITGLVIMALFFLWFFSYINGLYYKKNRINNFQSFREFFWPKDSRKEMKEIFGDIARFALGFLFYCSLLVVITSGVDIELDKDLYSVNDTVIAKITPYGIIPPNIIYVHYSNKNDLIYNGTKEPFRASTRIVQINPELLTNKNYNSHITVIGSYLYFNNNHFIREIYWKRIPVYTPTK